MPKPVIDPKGITSTANFVAKSTQAAPKKKKKSK